MCKARHDIPLNKEPFHDDADLGKSNLVRDSEPSTEEYKAECPHASDAEVFPVFRVNPVSPITIRQDRQVLMETSLSSSTKVKSFHDWKCSSVHCILEIVV